MHIKKISLLVLGALSLSGCLPYGKESEVNTFVTSERAKAKPSRQYKEEDFVEPAPYVPYQTKADLQDPFTVRGFLSTNQADDFLVESDCPASGCEGAAPPKEHNKEILEDYDINSLVLVGTLTKKGSEATALIRTPDLGIIPIGLGNYIGKDYGTVISITDNRIEIREKVREGTVWSDKRRTMIVE